MEPVIKINASEHPIKSVTVFKASKAEVVRTFSLQLKAGQNKIEIKGLPSTIDTHSVRVSGLGDARLFDVVCTIEQSNVTVGSADPNSSAEVIRVLREKERMLHSEIDVRDNELELLLKYAGTLTGERTNPTQMAQFLESFVEQNRKSSEAVSIIKEQLVQVQRQLAQETKKAQAKHGTALGEVVVVIGADNAGTLELKLTYIVSNAQWHSTYELHATTENGKPSSSVSLHYRARVTQGTGEDWSNTSLTLSTVASDTVAKSIPQLAPIKIRQQTSSQYAALKKGGALGSANVYQNNDVTRQMQSIQQQQAMRPQQQMQQQPQQMQQMQQQQQAQQSQLMPQYHRSAMPRSSMVHLPEQPQDYSAPPPPAAAATRGQATAGFASLALESASEYDMIFEEIALPEPISGATSVVTETPIAISYSVHGRSSIPSDGVQHQVSVAILPFEAKISHVTIPRIEPRVYLQCQVKNSSEYRLLPGPVSVILDDSYVSKTSINDVNVEDTFDCTLGDDMSTKVSYSRTSRTVRSTGGAFTEAVNTTTYTTRISIHNKHQFPIANLIVRDVIPTSDDKRAKVILRKPEGLADAKDGQLVDLKKDGLKVSWESLAEGKGGEKEGRFEWKWKVDSGAKVALEAEWEVKAPADIAWAETSTLFGANQVNQVGI